MTIEIVHGDTLEKRLSDLLAYQRSDIKIRIVSLHVYNPKILGKPFKEILEKLIRRQALVVIVIDKRQLSTDPAKQLIASELDDIGVRVHERRNLHAKLVILESRQDYGFLLSSANISNNALHNYKEAGLFLLNERRDLFDDLNSYVNKILGNP